ncbi:MAG TPA: glycogen/starch/alpha-glucan phosphorylase [Beijerinckiaceae bacterium]|nr:glycogen/starch/alpha-glucan phosphorylase [Beijerinckiaceae bacterium]
MGARADDESPAGAATDAGDRARRVEAFREAVLAKLRYAVGKDEAAASENDWFVALALAVRDRMVDRWIDSTHRTYREGRKRVYYLSLEFLIGRLLFDALGNLGLTATARAALGELGIDLDRLRALEPDAALGNGGLGRLAACFMESMASLELPAYGYGIRYDYGLFRQVITDGWQHEVPEDWLSFGNPWEFERPEVVYQIQFGGRVELVSDGKGLPRHIWHPAETVQAVAFDTPVVGWRGRHVNTLRLWSARAADPLRLETFNLGDYVGAMADRSRAEAISRVLYPSDATPAGQELRLRQEFFFTSASLQDLIRRHLQQFGTLESLAEHNAIQLNDTHPAIAVAELMRLLVDQHGMVWEQAWAVTRGTLNYTNHTLLPEALESWPVELLERLLPRHLQIVYLINWLHLERLSDEGRLGGLLESVSLIDERHGRRVRMGHLAFIGSGKVNGVSALHTELMRQTVFRDLHALYPDRIVNKTNGITFRRWLHQANPGLTRLLVEAAGPEVLDDAEALDRVAAVADDPAFQERVAGQRRANKLALARIVDERLQVAVDPDALFDVQIKRIHEYKRQLLNLLETVALYQAIKADPAARFAPRVKLFAGKAAASYAQAKLIIKLANDIGRVVNADPDVGGRLKVVFLPNYNVSLAEAIIPAADLSEQISTAGMEASGTGNMKLALNGALTIGTLDGANIEIREKVGPDNIVIFGLTAEEVEATRRRGRHAPRAIAASPRLSAVLDAVGSGAFSPDDPGRFRPLVDSLRWADPFLVTADFEAYWAAQREVDRLWFEPAAWWRMSILNTARIGWFSSDRTIAEYAREIWHAPVG